MRRPLLVLLLLLLAGVFAVSQVVPGRPADADSRAHRDIAQSSLLISKRAYPNPATAGHTLWYEINLQNTGPVTLTNVVVSDTIPAGTYFLTCLYVDCYVTGGVAYAYLDTLLGSTASFVLGVQVYPQPGVTQVVNDQYAAGASGVPPVYGDPVAVPVLTFTPYPGPTTAPLPGPTSEPEPLVPTPPGEPHLVLAQDVPAEMPAAGGEVTLHAIVTNDGTGGARDVVLALELPAGLEAAEVTILPAAASEWTGHILWVAWGYLEAGASASVEVRAVVRSDVPTGPEVIVGVPDYGLESRVPLAVPVQVLPSTGLGATPWWGWFALGGALLIGGVLLLQIVRRGDADRSSS